MSMIKKLIALTLALAMVLSVSAFAGYKADTYVDASAINADAADAVELMYALKIMKGDDKGQFRPEAGITRAEMAKMIYVILNYGNDDGAINYTGAKFFTDVEAGYWAEGYINYCASTKLIAGRGDGTFDPTANVTTAEAAKMLLTAIGYNAEHRGYTGAKWSENVLSDAAILGLLDGYKTSVNAVAPRQWVAVMVANALDCLTFDSMRPSFDGLLTSGTATTYKTMGQKYFGYETVKGIITSVNTYKIDGTVTAGAGNVVIGGVKIKAAASIEDLGQEYKAIVVNCKYDANDKLISGTALSLRNTGKSVVAEDEVKDVSYELTYATSGNAANNKYVFTVGDLSGKLDSVKKVNGVEYAVANVLDVVAGNNTFEQLEASELKTEIAKGARRNDVVRAIDSNGDGDIEYVIYTPVEYAKITKVATSQKYGEYVKATAANGTALTINGGSNLYLKDCIISDAELAVEDIVKFTWNIDKEKYNVEVLDVTEAVKFESRKNNKYEYTFAGETSVLAANAFDIYDTISGANVLGKNFDIVVDGDLLVYVELTDGNYKTMDEVNAQLAVLIMADNLNVDIENTKHVKLLTIDGNVEWYAYDNATARSKGGVVWADLVDADYNETEPTWDELYIKHETANGVWLEEINVGENKQLDTELFDVFAEAYAADSLTLEVKDGKATYGGCRVPADYKFFAYVNKEYTVITMADLENGKYAKVEVEFALVDDGTYYDSIVGGYFRIGKAAVSTEGFLFVTEVYEKETTSGKTILANIEGVGEKEIKLSAESDEPALNNCYYYTFDGTAYTLDANWTKWTTFVADDGLELWYGDGASLDLSKFDMFALKTYEKLREEGDTEWEVIDITVEFVTAEELMARIEACEELVAEDDLTYSFEYRFNVEAADSIEDTAVLYVTIIENMVANQETLIAE